MTEDECKKILSEIRKLKAKKDWVHVSFGIWQRVSDGLCYSRYNSPDIKTVEKTERVPYAGSHLHHCAENYAAYGDEQCTMKVQKGQKSFAWTLIKIPPHILTGTETPCRLPGPVETMLEANNGKFVDFYSGSQLC